MIIGRHSDAALDDVASNNAADYTHVLGVWVQMLTCGCLVEGHRACYSAVRVQNSMCSTSVNIVFLKMFVLLIYYSLSYYSAERVNSEPHPLGSWKEYYCCYAINRTI